MDELAKLLAYLDQAGVTELVLGTGRPVSVRRHGQYIAMGKEEVSKAQLGGWLIGTPFEALIPGADGVSKRTEIVVIGRRVATLLTRRGKDLTVRIELVAGVAAVEPEPEPPKRKRPTQQPSTKAIELDELSLDDLPTFELADVPQRREHAAERAELMNPGAPKPRTRAPTNSIAPATVPPVKFKKPGVVAPRTVSAFDIELDPGDDADAAIELDTTSIPVLARADLLPSPPAKKSPLAEVAPLPAAAPRRAPLDVDPARRELRPPPPPSNLSLSFDDDLGLSLGDLGDAFAPPPPVAPPPVAPVARVAPVVVTPVVVAPVVAPSPAVVAPIAASVPAPTGLTLIDEPADASTMVALVAAARARGATDLHVASGRATMIRTVGELVALDPKPLSADAAAAILLPILGPQRRARLAERGYIDLALDLPKGGGRLRANISRQQLGYKGSFRLAFPHPPTLEELHLPAELAKVVSHHQGLVVFAGPSGHGKTTTLAALVDLINSTRPHHVLAIEDPVEIEHPRKRAVVSQREVGRHTTSFAAALKASLREDPDVIVIGELRDRETVEIALTAAETGHLVMATMSTPSAAKTIDRLIDMFPPDDQNQVRASLAGALRAIVAQRLLPRLDGKGVVPAIEILTGVLPLASLIRDNRLFQLPNLMQRGRAFGMVRLDDSLLELARSGVVDQELALRAADSRKEMLAQLRPAAPAVEAAVAKKGGLGGLFGGRKDHNDR